MRPVWEGVVLFRGDKRGRALKGGEADRFAGYKRGRRANFRAQRKQARKGEIQQKKKENRSQDWERWDLCSLTENIFA